MITTARQWWTVCTVYVVVCAVQVVTWVVR